MARTAKPAHDDTQTGAPVSRRVLVNIYRDQTASTPRVVWQHEVPIIEAIFGEGNAKAVPIETLDEGFSGKPTPDMLAHNKVQDVFRRPSESLGIGFVFVGEARAEYERLAQAYGMNPEVKQPWVETVYGRFSTGMFAKIIGEPDLKDMPPEQLRQMLLAWGYTLPIVDFKASEAEKKAASAAAAEFRRLPADKLVALAEELGVEV